MRRSLVTTVLTCALAALGAAPASAGTLSISGGKVVYQAAPGETNVITAQFTFRTGLLAIVRDAGARITAGPGCVALGQRGVCPLAPQSMLISTGDRDDRVTVTGAAVEFHGGTGNDVAHSDTFADVLYGDSGNDQLYGQSGDDTLDGGSGDDYLDGGPGADQLDPGLGADVVHGGANASCPPETACNVLDRLSYIDRTADVNVTLNGIADDGEAGEHDNVFPDVENIVSGSGNDTLNAMTSPCCVSSNPSNYALTGREGNDTLIGGNGDDFLNGDVGDDVLRGNGGYDDFRAWLGDDTIFARDGGMDDVDCSDGNDSAQIDPGLEFMVFQCETLLP